MTTDERKIFSVRSRCVIKPFLRTFRQGRLVIGVCILSSSVFW